MKSIRTIAIGLAVLGSFALTLPSSAQVMNYQGLLTDTAGAPLDPGQYTVTFNIYDHPTNTAPANLVWGPFRFDGVARPKVNLSGGRFNVVLGPNDATSRSLTDIFNNGSPRFLGITVGGNPEILPRQQILASPTAIHAQRADHATTATAVGNPGQAGAIQILNGNVGIGTSQPGNKLEVAGNASVFGNFFIEDIIGGDSIAPDFTMANRDESFFGVTLQDQDTPSQFGAFRYDSGTNDLGLFNGNATPRVTIESNGEVGIGITDPVTRLQVTGGVDASLASHGFMVLGEITSSNLVFDDNEIVARSNGGVGTLYLQNDGGNLIVGNAASTVTINGTINGEDPPWSTSLNDDTSTAGGRWGGAIVPSSVVESRLGDADGGRVKFLFRNNGSDEVRVIESLVYIEQASEPGDFQTGLTGWCREQGGADQSFVLDTAAKHQWSTTPWNWISITNYDHFDNTAAYTGTEKYKWFVSVPRSISVTIIIYDN